MIDIELIDPGEPCIQCGGCFGIHGVKCPNFHCRICGKKGHSPEHYGGCPTLRDEDNSN